jgi:EF hand
MQLHRQALLSVTVLFATAVYAAPPAGRPDLATAKPIATCQLQTLATKKPDPDELVNAMIYTGRPVDDPLSNYEHTSLGDWPMLAAAERTDPWLRMVLLSRKRPVVIDLAVLIDGKSFRDKRDSWIDELVSMPKAPASQPATKDSSNEKGNNKPESAGTKPAVKPSESATAKADAPKDEKKAPAKDEKKDEKKEEKAYSGPTTKPKSREVPSMRDRLADYLSTNKTRVDREELGWLIAAWGAGPGVILLDPSLSWQRSEVSPLETYLDRNGDGTFAREEIAQADSVLQRADVDSNDVVDMNEIRRALDHPAFAFAAGGYPLVVVLDASTDALKLESTMANIYKSQPSAAAGTKGPVPTVADLRVRPADIILQVNLGTSDKSATGVSVLSLGSELSKSNSAASATTNVATVELDGDYVEVSAAQGAPAPSGDSAASQIAIGAAFDGNPLLRLLDRDNDGRLTRRERQEVSGLFASLDRNGDGAVSSSEVPVPIRLAVTLGPHVHELLATPAPAARETTPRSAAPTAPGWFKSMDKNNDSDLSRSEFLGTTEQFKQLDTNGDGLLSIAEALKLKTGK